MGVAIRELLKKKDIEIPDLKGKTIAVDGANQLYQFLTTIRQHDGSVFTDSEGRTTSHLIGLLSRTSNLMKNGLKLVYAFDGKVPDLKRAETRKRMAAKEEAARKFEEAKEAHDVDEMKKYAGRTSRLTSEMLDDAKELLDAFGIPYITAPSEGEAQAAFMVRKGDCYAVASQDADCLLFGAPLVIRNLSISGRRKLPGKLGFVNVVPQLISLSENLESLGITREQLIYLSMLVGTDYNTGGIKGIGPKKALSIVKKHNSPKKIFEEVKWSDYFTTDWQEIYDLIYSMPAVEDYELKFGSVNPQKAIEILCEKHGFARDRVEKAIADIKGGQKDSSQKGLMDFA